MIPNKYSFLNDIGTLPKLVSAAIQFLGIKEIPGNGSNPVIMDMANQIGLKGIYTNDDTSWCAVFICYLCKLTGKPLPSIKGDIYNLMRANSFTWWGEEVPIEMAKLGDVIVKRRTGGNHVCLYIAESKETFHEIGGNQSNSVTFSEINKSDVIAVRRPFYTVIPDTVDKYIIDSSGNVSQPET